MNKKIDRYCFGADIGGTTIKLGMFTPGGDIIKKWEIPTRKEDKGAHILEDIADSIHSEMEERGLSRDNIIGVGAGAPGPVDKDGVIYRAVNLGWGVMNMQQELFNLVKLPVRAANDANVAALGEMWKGGGEGFKDLVVVTLGTGVGGGVITDGKVITGSLGGGGEIGHIHINDNEPEICGCGNRGCLEQYTSATGIVRLANRRLKADNMDSALRACENLTSKDVFDAVKEGDLLAMEIAEQFGEFLGKGLATVAAVTNPEVFVIGGGVSKAGPVLLDYVQKYYKEYVFHASREAKFKLATLGNDAGIYGAARLVLE